jgi:hypothetical protein
MIGPYNRDGGSNAGAAGEAALHFAEVPFVTARIKSDS